MRITEQRIDAERLERLVTVACRFVRDAKETLTIVQSRDESHEGVFNDKRVRAIIEEKRAKGLEIFEFCPSYPYTPADSYIIRDKNGFYRLTEGCGAAELLDRDPVSTNRITCFFVERLDLGYGVFPKGRH